MPTVRNQTQLQLPFKGSWLCFWGGDKPAQNHHHHVSAQRYAFDFIKTASDGSFYKDNQRDNNHSYSFGEPVLSPADGIIIEAVDGIRDNQPGNLNTYMISGNHLLIKHTDNEYSMLAHLKNGSLRVKAGDTVRAGEHIGSCGNSGYSTDAHLHYQLQNSDILATYDADYKLTDVAKGIKVYFTSIIRKRNGKVTSFTSHSPIKGDSVQQA